MASEASIFQKEKGRFKRGDNPTPQKAHIIGGATTKAEKASSRFQAEDSNPTIGVKVTSAANESDASFSVTKSKLDDYVDTAPEQKDMEPTMPLNSSYFGDLKKLIKTLISIASIGLLVLIFIAVILTCNFWTKIQSGQTQGSGYNITCCVKYEGVKEEYLPILYDSTPQSGKNSRF